MWTDYKQILISLTYMYMYSEMSVIRTSVFQRYWSTKRPQIWCCAVRNDYWYSYVYAHEQDCSLVAVSYRSYLEAWATPWLQYPVAPSATVTRPCPCLVINLTVATAILPWSLNGGSHYTVRSSIVWSTPSNSQSNLYVLQARIVQNLPINYLKFGFKAIRQSNRGLLTFIFNRVSQKTCGLPNFRLMEYAELQAGFGPDTFE